MKNIVLVRHAKSSWSNPDLEDRQRPLKNSGIRDATYMSQHLLEQNLIPNFILSSPAKRALQTANIFNEEMFDNAITIQEEEGLYFEGVEQSINLLSQLSEEVETVFLFGHMPDIASLFMELTDEFVMKYPTCAVAHIQFEIDNWRELNTKKGKKMLFLYPKMMPWREAI